MTRGDRFVERRLAVGLAIAAGAVIAHGEVAVGESRRLDAREDFRDSLPTGRLIGRDGRRGASQKPTDNDCRQTESGSEFHYCGLPMKNGSQLGLTAAWMAIMDRARFRQIPCLRVGLRPVDIRWD
jgi:hypothetical protein